MLKFLLLIICSFPLLCAAQTLDYKVSGIEGDVLENVQHRLSAFQKNKAIVNADALQLQVEKALYPYGYFKPQITIDSGHHIIHILLGPQLKITDLTLEVKGEGRNDFKIQQVVHNLPISKGQAFINSNYEDAKEKLSTTAENQGYLHASFQKSAIFIDKEAYTAKIFLVFDTGPRFYFGQMHFDPTYISPSLLQRYVPFKYGQPYSTEQILTLNSHLAASGYFNNVNVTPTIKDDIHVPINVHLQPVRHRLSYSLGAGYGTDTGPRGLGSLHVIPVNRYGHKFNAIAQGSLAENALQAQYIIPGFNPVIDNYSISGGITNLDYNTGHSTAVLLSLSQQHVLSDFQRILSVSALNERYNYTGFNSSTETLLYPRAIFTWSKTSDPLFSPSGYNITLNGLAASKALLSQVNLGQVAVDAKAAITFDSLRTRLYFHGIQGGTLVDDVSQIPLSLAQLLGGAGNLKGYNYNSLGPGKIMTYGGVEVQKETFNKWYFLGFIDGGDVYNPSLKEFKYDLGLGLMWVSPVGPIKIGLAQAVNQRFDRRFGRLPKLVINMGPDLS